MLNTIKLEMLRKQFVLKQQDVAEKINVNVSTYGNLLRSGDFRATQLVKLSELYRVPIGYLFDEFEMNNQNPHHTNFQVNTNGAILEQKNINIDGKVKYYLEEIKNLKIQIKQLENNNTGLQDKIKLLEEMNIMLKEKK